MNCNNGLINSCRNGQLDRPHNFVVYVLKFIIIFKILGIEYVIFVTCIWIAKILEALIQYYKLLNNIYIYIYIL